MDAPVIAFGGWSGSGKTTLIEKLIPLLHQAGLRTAVLKDGHGLELDKPGKDSWRFSEAGAELVAVSDGRRSAVFENRPADFYALLSRVHDVDLVLAEGWNSLPLPRIVLCREGEALRCGDGARLIAVLGSPSEAPEGVPVLSRDDAAGAAGLILDFIGRRGAV